MRKTWSILIVIATALVLSCTLLVPLVSAEYHPLIPPPGYAPPPNLEAPPKGYTYRPEWEPHKATWLSWGHHWQEEEIRGLQIQMIDALQEGEEVHVIVDSAQQEAAVKRMMKMAGVPPDNVFIHIIPADDIWLRDWAPTWIDNGVTQAIVDWEFDGWGEQSLSWEYNNLADRKIAELLDQEFYSYVDYIVDGSACFLVNGKGTAITTESLLDPRIRDPVPTSEEIEEAFAAYLGVRKNKIIWLEGYLTGDTYTYGHANTLAKFVNENTVFCPWQPDPEGLDYDVCVNNYEILVGAGLNVVKVPLAQNTIFAYGGSIQPNYINSYIGNAVVLVPIFDDPSDAEVLALYEEYFPTRTVIGLDCRLLQSWGGAINCITQQQPLVP